MRIGPYNLLTIESGEFALDGGAMFGIVPKPLWEKRIGVDARNRIDMRVRCLLIHGDVGGKARTILVDTGMGTKWNEKEKNIYRVDFSRYELIKCLRDAGVGQEDVTDVILSHLHFDHAGGATTLSTGGKVVPTFPRATYYVQRTHWEWANNPTDKDRGSFMERDFVPLHEAGQLTLLSPNEFPFPGISFRITNGHTVGLQHPLISDGENTVFFCADLVPTSLHIHIPWVMAYDIRPLDTIAEKKAILAEAAQNGWLLVFEHCPLTPAARVVRNEKGYQVGESVIF